MAASAKRTSPKLWDAVKADVTRGDKGGDPGQWSARKAQLAVAEYKKRGGGYEGRKASDNHLVQWTEENWGTKSGKPSGETHERYLPKTARDRLTENEYRRTTAKKRADTAKGRQFSRQPQDVADKVAPTRSSKRADSKASHQSGDGATKAELLREARKRNIPGRSSMTRAELMRAVQA